MDVFKSSALGAPHEYHLGLLSAGALVAHSKLDLGASLACRVDAVHPWMLIHHNSTQVRQVLKDHDVFLAQQEHPE